jgi:hypothetical protein
MLIPGKSNPTSLSLFTLLHALLILCVQIFGIDVNLVISFDGAVIGFFVVYFFPISLHLRNVFRNSETVPLMVSEEMGEEGDREREGKMKYVEVGKYAVLGLVGVCFAVFKIMKYL